MATDRERFDAAGRWILQNQDKAGTPDYEAVAATYKQLRNSPTIEPFDPLTSDLTPKPVPQSAHDRFVGMTSALANNVPFGEEMATGVSVGLNKAAEALGVPGTDPRMSDYGSELERVRKAEAGYREEHPMQSLAVSTVPGLVAFGGAGLATSAPTTAANVGTPLSRSLFGLGTGAGVGAAYGAGAADGSPEDRFWGGVNGGTIGGIVGAAAPAIATGAGNLYGAAREALTVNPTLTRLGIGKPAAEIVGNAYQSDDIMGNALAQLRGAGPNGMLADAGPNSAKMLDQVVQEGGPATDIARRAVDTRANAMNNTIQHEFDRRLGQPVPVGSGQEAMRNAARPTNARNYDAAYDLPVDYAQPQGQEILRLLRQVPRQAIRAANEQMRKEGHASRQVRVTLNPDGTIAFESLPDVRQLDYITRAMNETAYGSDGGGSMGGITQSMRADRMNSADIRSHLRDLVPEYATALNEAAPPIRQARALEFGNRLLSPAVTRDEVMMETRGMGGAELRTAAQGVRQNLDDVMANVKRVASDPNQDARQALEQLKAVSSNAAREKIAMLIGDREAMHLFNQMDEAMRAFELRARVATNSMTAPRMFAAAAKDAATEPGVMGLAMQGEIPKATKRLISTATGATPQRMLARKQDINREIALALTGPRGPAAETYITDLMRANQQRMLSQQAASNAVRTGRMLAPLSANPTRRSLSEK